MVSHKERPRFDKAMPAHVTLRVLDDVPSLRSSRRFAVIRRCLAAARGLHEMRLVEFTVMGNHLHLIVEADSNGSLSR
jgi:REP element-mobilizing transposase RayT